MALFPISFLVLLKATVLMLAGAQIWLKFDMGSKDEPGKGLFGDLFSSKSDPIPDIPDIPASVKNPRFEVNQLSRKFRSAGDELPDTEGLFALFAQLKDENGPLFEVKSSDLTNKDNAISEQGLLDNIEATFKKGQDFTDNIKKTPLFDNLLAKLSSVVEEVKKEFDVEDI